MCESSKNLLVQFCTVECVWAKYGTGMCTLHSIGELIMNISILPLNLQIFIWLLAVTVPDSPQE